MADDSITPTEDQSASPSAVEVLQKHGYMLGEKLGAGAYATVRKCLYFSPIGGGKEVALAVKIINRKKLPRDFMVKFFPRELNISIRLDHLHLIRVHSILERNEFVYIFMQFAEKGDVLTYIQKEGNLNEHQANFWARQLFSGISYLFSKNMCHRDLKCENLLLTKHYNLKIADFGFARYTLTKNGKSVLSETYCGSAAYAAPEVLAGIPYEPRPADLWSCGIILYAFHCAAFPFKSDDPKKQITAQLYKKWDIGSQIKKTLTNEAKDLVRSLLEPDKEKRLTLEGVKQHPWMEEKMFRKLMDKYYLNK